MKKPKKKRLMRRVIPTHHVSMASKQRKLACVILGDGIGNIIQQTPLLIAACKWFDTVDLMLPRSSPQCAQLFTNFGLPALRHVITSSQMLRKRKVVLYDATFLTWLVDVGKQYTHSVLRYSSKSPLAYKTTESAAAFRAIQHAGYDGPCPDPRSGWQDTPGLDLPGSPLIGISTGSQFTRRWMAKRYPHYLAVINHILTVRPTASFVHLGVDTDTQLPHPRVLDLRSKISLGCSAGVLRRCQAFMGNDTGLTHVAAALNIPSVVVFGPTLVKKNAPPKNAVVVRLGLPCQPCQAKTWFHMPGQTTPCQLECMRDLPAARVATAVLEALDG